MLKRGYSSAVAAALLYAGIVSGCGGSEDDAGESESDPTSASGDDHCECLGDDDGGELTIVCEPGPQIYASAICSGTEMPEPGMTSCEPPFSWSYSTQQIDQALVALRDRELATISMDRSLDGGYSRTFSYIYSLGDGTVFFTSGFYEDSGWLTPPLDHLELKSEKYFSECLAQADLDLRSDCLFDVGDELIGVCE